MSTLREVVADHPEHVYTAPDHMADDYLSCYYVHVDADGGNQRPGCLIGVVLNRLGVPLDVLATREGSGAYVVTSSLVETSSDVANALERAQDKQDNGATWAEALAAAEAGMPEGVVI
jgi:hypothetical protein